MVKLPAPFAASPAKAWLLGLIKTLWGVVDVITGAGAIVRLPLYSPESVIVTVCAASATTAAVVDCVDTARGLPASEESEPESSVPDTTVTTAEPPPAALEVAVGECSVAPATRGRLLAPVTTAGCVPSPV